MLIRSLTQRIEWLATHNRLFYKLTAQYYKNIILREARLAHIRENDNLLCIGGGPCPYTAIMLHKLTGVRVTVVDNNQGCVARSQELIKRMRLDKDIHILHNEGDAVNCRGFSIIHLAMQISPKEQVLKSLWQKAQVGAKILVRMPKSALCKFYCCSRSGAELACSGSVLHDRFSNVHNTFLYIKEDPCEISA
ncbi:MAG: hypothetical protein ACOYI4_03200 [Christensenellales bacterium]|jgi:hypothetical protein